MNGSDIQNNHGVWTFRLEDGRASIDQVAPNITDSWEQVDGDIVIWRLATPQEGGFVVLRWSVEPDGTLQFTEAESSWWSRNHGAPAWEFDLPWPRVGDL